MDECLLLVARNVLWFWFRLAPIEPTRSFRLWQSRVFFNVRWRIEQIFTATKNIVRRLRNNCMQIFKLPVLINSINVPDLGVTPTSIGSLFFLTFVCLPLANGNDAIYKSNPRQNTALPVIL